MRHESPFANRVTFGVASITALLGFTSFFAGLSGCSDRFAPCKESRTCQATGGGGAGSADIEDAEHQGGARSDGGADSSPACERGAFSCQGQLVLQCQGGTWTQVGSCPFACLGEGECGGECVPDARDCDGNTPRACTSEGTWTELEACPEACAGAGNCIGQCIPGTKDCLDGVPRACSPEGEWQESIACPFVCSGPGECAGECTPKDAKCEGNVPHVCHDAGVWIAQEACEKVCNGKGECAGACKPGDKDCSGNVPRTCNEQGEWDEGTACEFVCTGAGECAGECVPGAKACDGYGYKSCSADGVYAHAECPTATPVCSGEGVCGGSCVDGTQTIDYDATVVGECCTTSKGTGFLVQYLLDPVEMRCTGSLKELALNKPVIASSYAPSKPPSNVTDQDLGSLWKASSPALNEWVRIDLGATVSTSGLVMKFEQPGAYGYKVETSTNDIVWGIVTSGKVSQADAASQDVVFTPKNVRHVRITFTSLPAGRSAALSSVRMF